MFKITILFIGVMCSSCNEIPNYIKEYKVIDKQTIVEHWDLGTMDHIMSITYYLKISYKNEKDITIASAWIIINSKEYQKFIVGKIYKNKSYKQKIQ